MAAGWCRGRVTCVGPGAVRHPARARNLFPVSHPSRAADAASYSVMNFLRVKPRVAAPRKAAPPDPSEA